MLEYRDPIPLGPGGSPIASVALGDLNGDGIHDLVVGVPWQGLGEVHVLFGGKSLPALVDWTDPGVPQALLQGEPEVGHIGTSIALPGDLNGDGLGDLVLSGESRVLVLFGREDWESVLTVSQEVMELRAAILPGQCGMPSLAAAGELLGAWPPAFLLGGDGQCRGSSSSLGLFTEGFEDPALAGAPSVVIQGSDRLAGADGTPLSFGSSLGGAGDLNGDGHPDLVLGAQGRSSAGFLVLGPGWEPGQLFLDDLHEAGRVVRVKESREDSSLWISAAAPGDFNGDGLSDAVFGFDGDVSLRGEAHVIFGSKDLGVSIRDLDLSTPGIGHLRIEGEYTDDRSGFVSSLGDWNADGLMDFGIMGHDAIHPSARAYVILGNENPSLELKLSDLPGREGFRIVGARGAAFTGQKTGGMTGGDLNGDGLLDVALAETTTDGHRAVVVILGSRSGAARAFVRGDINGDGAMNLTDVVNLLGHLFGGERVPGCLDAADTDDSGNINVTDALYLLGYLFLGARILPQPQGAPGPDPTPDDLGC